MCGFDRVEAADGSEKVGLSDGRSSIRWSYKA
jgi:hypothetical protein